jgi:hypothetical protein
MKNYLHRVVGVYETRVVAEWVLDDIVLQGLAPEQISILEPGSDEVGAGGSAGNSDVTADSDDVLREMLRDGAIGTAVGTVAGAVGTVALSIANISLFIASPVVGALSMLGWGASLGAVVGAVAGAQNHKGEVADLVKDALENGHVVLVAHTDNEQQTRIVKQIVEESMSEFCIPLLKELQPQVPAAH